MNSSTLRPRGSKHKMPCSDEEIAGTKSVRSTKEIELDKAISSGNFVAVKEILKCKDQKVSKMCLQATLLKAAQEGRKQIIQLLLSHGICFQESSESGCLPVIAAARQGYLDIVKLLTRNGASINGRDSSGKTALMAAVENSCCSALITFLLEDCKADVNLQDNEGKTALMLAVEQWDYETVQILFLGNNDEVKDYNCLEDVKDNYGRTALDLAELNGSAGLFNVLRESRKHSCSPLSIAAGWNNLDLVRRLLEIHPFCVDNVEFGEEPLSSAMHGLENDQETWDGEIHCSFELMNLLLQLGVNVNSCHLCGHTPLMFAACAGSNRAVEILLLHKAFLDDISYEMTGHRLLKSRTALMMAAHMGHVSIVETLIQAGADLKKEDNDGEDALRLAIIGGHRDCVQALLKHWSLLSQYDIEIMEEHRMLEVLTDVKDRWKELLDFEDTFMLQDLLCKAIGTRCYQLVKTLIESGADANFIYETRYHYEDPCYLHPLCHALNDVDMLALLVDMGADINFQPKHGKTALMDAASNGNKTHVENLLKCNADVYVNSYGSTALSMASVKGHDEVVTALLESGMDINHVSDNRTALWTCLYSQNYRAIETLIKHGADVNFAGLRGVTVLMQAAKHSPLHFLELIINSGADINAQDDYGGTALFYALQIHKRSEDTEEKVSLLVKHGANVNHINLAMKTPLMVLVAAELGSQHNSVIKVLLDAQPDLNAQDAKGDTAAHLAVKNRSADNLKMLANKGADMNIVNHENKNLLLIAFVDLNEILTETLIRHGATMNQHNSQNVRREWKRHLDIALKRFLRKGSEYRRYFEIIKCLQTLLWSGGSLHIVEPLTLNEFLFLCIFEDEFILLTLLVKSGVGPNSFCLSNLSTDFRWDVIIDAAAVCNLRYISPLCMAILLDRPKIVAMFALASFYCPEDVKILQHPHIKQLIQPIPSMINEDLFSLDDLCPEKWSLRSWSKLAVLRAVGYSEGKEQRVRALPIPQGVQDELLFKKIPL